MNKKVIAVVTAFAMLTGTFSTVFASSDSEADSKVQQKIYSDISGHWAAEAIDKWSGLGVISGNQGLFRPDASITRGEMACILDNIMDYQVSAKNTFSDLKDGRFYTNSVLKVNAAGIMNGDGASKLRPTDKITREEAAVMLAKAFAVSNGDTSGTKFGDAGEISLWAKTALSGMESKGYIKGTDGKCNPKANITRAETVAIINNIVKAYYTKAGTYTGNVEGTAVVKVSDIVLKGVTVSENLIIAEGVGKGDATLKDVTVKGNTVVRGGGENSIHIEGSSDIKNVKVEKNGDKLRIVVEGSSAVKTIEVAAGEEIIIKGAVETVEIKAEDVKVLAIDAKISNAVVSGSNTSIIVDKGSKIENLSVNDKAANTAIKTEEGSSVGKITASAKTDISGQGAVKEVNFKEGAKDSSVTTPNTQITAATGVTGVTGAGKKVIEAGSSVTNNNKGDGIAVPVPGPVPGPIPIPMPTGGGNAGGNNGTDTSSVTVSKVLAISPIIADNGTEAGKLGLPSSVDVDLSDGSKAKANVTWNTANFNGTKAGDVILNGTLSIPSGSTWTMTDAQKSVSIKVTVRAAALEVSSVSAINSKIIEISLTTAITDSDLAGNTFSLENTTGASINIVSTALAPWSDKSVLVTLGADTEEGTMYTLTIGTKSFKFAGKSKDTVKPAVAMLEATDANEITITFNKAIKLDTLKTVISESNATTEVVVNSMKYDGSNRAVLSVGDMKDAALYKCIVTNVTDLSGNQLEHNRIETTFTGRAKPTDMLKFADTDNARSNFCDEVVVKFNVNVDPAALIPANFSIAEKYGYNKTPVNVLAVRVAKKGDMDTSGNKTTSIDTDAKGRNYAILTVAGTQNIIYEIKFKNLKTLYGVAQSSVSDEYTATFVGSDVSRTPVELMSNNVGASIYTSFTINFKKNMDKTLAETISNYTMEEAVTKKPLKITNAALQSDGKTVKFTTDFMKTTQYKLTILNLKDIYGNLIKTADSANIVTVAGISAEDAAKRITQIQSITRSLPAGSNAAFDPDTQIVVYFNNNVGANATDITLYTIDDGIGNPLKIDRVDGAGNENKVILTIGKTAAGTSYKLTVKGLLNSAGIPVVDNGMTASFAGRGNAYSKPKMQSIIAIDKQTIKVCFDRNVDSPDIMGYSKIWTENGINAGALRMKYSSEADTSYHNLPLNKAWKDPDNANVLIIRSGEPDTFKSSPDMGTKFVLDGTGDLLEGDNDKVEFENNVSEVARPQINGILANDDRNITVYFDQAVVINGTSNQVFTIGSAKFATDSNNIEVAVGVAPPARIDDKTYKIHLNSSLTDTTYYLRVADMSDITDKSGYINFKPDDYGNYAAVKFGGTSVHVPVYITDVSVMMTDKSTIKVYYPERMDKATVTNVANYRIYKDSSGYMPSDGISVPTAVVYDADANTATLYLSGDTISGTANNIYYLGIRDSVTDETAYKKVKSDKLLTSLGNGLLVSFAVSTSDDAKPQIKNVSVAVDDNTKITVEFDEAVSTSPTAIILKSGIATSDNQIVINDAEWGVVTTPSSIGLFQIKNMTTFINVPLVSTRKISNTKFEIVVATPINLINTYELTISSNGPKTIYNLGGTQAETDLDKRQKFLFTAIK